MESDFSDVVDRVSLLAQVSIDPILSSDEVESIVERTARASTFAAGAYAYGDYVIPTTPNGRRYMVTEAGTATTEPTWPETGSVTSGDVEFTESGPLTGSVYDIRKAVHECWMLKAAKISGPSVVLGQGRAEGQDYTYLNCIRMAERYAPLEIA